jgi:hypothetical protein
MFQVLKVNLVPTFRQMLQKKAIRMHLMNYGKPAVLPTCKNYKDSGEKLWKAEMVKGELYDDAIVETNTVRRIFGIPSSQ